MQDFANESLEPTEFQEQEEEQAPQTIPSMGVPMTDPVRPVQEQPAPKTVAAPAPKPTVSTVKQRTNTDKLNELVERYDRIANEARVAVLQGKGTMKQATLAFIAIYNFVNATNDQKVYEELLTMFAKKANGTFSEKIILGGITYITDLTLRQRISFFCQVFVQLRNAMRGERRITMVAGTLQPVLGNERLANWAKMKISNLSAVPIQQ